MKKPRDTRAIVARETLLATQDELIRVRADLDAARKTLADTLADPIPMLLFCPWCRARHVDANVFATKPHHTHACQTCGGVWRPAVVPTVGVQFLPGFKDTPLRRVCTDRTHGFPGHVCAR